jgi:hypothetical protein
MKRLFSLFLMVVCASGLTLGCAPAEDTGTTDDGTATETTDDGTGTDANGDADTGDTEATDEGA